MSQNLFFYEYIEGSSYNKALEIFNPANDEIELTGWELWRIANGGDWTEGKSNAVNLSNYVISATNVFVLCHSSIDSEYYSLCNLTGKNTTIFNGDDAITLTYNDVIIDVIGESGDDPGTGWDVAGESNATKNHTLMRSSSITSGNGGDWTTSAGTNSDNSEWIVLSEDDFTNLGTHNCNSCSESLTICDDNNACYFLAPCIQDCSGALGSSLTIDVCGECGGSIDDTLNCNLKIKAVNPNKFPLLYSYPNPFNSTTTISILYQGYTHVKLDIIDLNGRIVDSIFSGYLSRQDSYTFLWDGTENKSGIYFARISQNKKMITHKIILLK